MQALQDSKIGLISFDTSQNGKYDRLNQNSAKLVSFPKLNLFTHPCDSYNGPPQNAAVRLSDRPAKTGCRLVNTW